MNQDDAIWLLDQWGIWSRKDGTGKLRNTSSAMFAGLETPNDDDELYISDHKAMQIDEVICALDVFNRDAWLVLMMKNYYKMSDASISERCGFSRHTVQKYRESGVAFLSGFIVAYENN